MQLMKELDYSELVKQAILGKVLADQYDMISYLIDDDYNVVIGSAAKISRSNIFPLRRQGSYAKYLHDQVAPVLHGDESEKQQVLAALGLEKVKIALEKHEPYTVNIVCDIDGERYYKRFVFYRVDKIRNFYLVLKSDTTDLQREQIKHNESLKLALAEANQANVAKTAFLSSMSHEIRTPMNAIIGLDSIALREPNLSPRTVEHLTRIGDSARHLLSLINDILDMSRIESGRMVLKNEEFSFRDMMEQLYTMIEVQCQERGISYTCRVVGHIDAYYVGDEMKLKQVLINILGNAVKFTQTDGRITFTVESVARFEDKETLRFVIQDTGIGIDKEFLPRIFDVFAQENLATTSIYGGSGLGLAITKNIVEMMNGEISVVSQKGVGSSFTVHVTLHRAPEKNAAAAENFETEGFVSPKKLTALDNRRILLAEDMPINAEIMKELLHMKNMQVDHAADGEQTVKKFAASPEHYYDAVLMDVRMPKMDGLTAATKIRTLKRADSRRVPIIALTANAFDEDVQRSLQAGMNAHLSKPVDPEHLYETLSELIEE